MRKTDIRYQTYLKILEEELLPAMGCTEPIAVAYAAAMARDLLGSMPVRMEVNVSGNILKNVKSVVVPNTGGLRGIQAAAAAGAAVGQAERELEVIAQVTSEQVGEIRTFLERCPIQVGLAATSQIFYIEVLAFGGDGSNSEVAISGFHTNVIRKRRNGQLLLQREEAAERESPCDEKSLLSIEGALEFADTVELDDVRALVQRQIDYNYAIAQEGLRGNYGANIGSVLLKHDGDDVKVRAKAYAAAGSDARMNGCELPVIINSGSGNQGITCSVPLIEYAKELHSGKEKLYRALIISNLVAIHEKTGIGTLSAYCGAVSAGAGAGAGIVYLCGDGYQAAIHTVVNALAIVSGIVCDGAKASCAAKIASSVDAALLGYNMYKCHQEFKGGDGIVMKDIETTIKGIGRLGKNGMKETNEEIIRLMIE